MSAEKVSDVVHLSREYRPAMMAYFLRRVHDRSDAEDLTQEVFARIAGRPEQQCNSGYLFQIAANLLRDRQRRSRIRADYRASLGEIEAQNVETLDPYRVAAGRDSIATMRAALDELPEMTATIFTLYRLEYMNKQVIGDTFGIAVRTVEKHLTAAMAFLTDRLGDEL